MNVPLAFAAGMFGAALASFLEVLADRLPREERPFGRSSCFSCKRRLRWFELIPIVSWLMLRGRCRTCGVRIPLRHLAMEIGLAGLFVAAVLTMPEPFDPWLLFFRLILLSVLTLVFIADLRYFIIPDVASLGLFLGAVLLVVSAQFFSVPWEDAVPSLKLAALGGMLGAAFLGAFSVISRGTWMGWGDVKLALGLGVAFGFPEILLLLAFAFILGSVVGLGLIALRLRGMRDILPFGPFICLAALPFLFGFGDSLLYFFGLVEFFPT